MIYRSILVSLFALGAGYVLLTSQIVLDPWSEMDAINSRTLPYLYGTGLMLCAFMLAWQQPNKVEVSRRLLPLGSGVFGDHYFYHFVALHRLVVGIGRAAIAQYADHGRA